jgi:hypothetical protein
MRNQLKTEPGLIGHLLILMIFVAIVVPAMMT